MSAVRWVPGSGWGIVTGTVIAWLSADWAPDDVESAFEHADRGLADLMGWFGLERRAPLAAASLALDEVAVAAAGATLRATTAYDEVRLTGRVERPNRAEIVDVTSIELGTAPSGSHSFAVTSGIVSCGGLRWESDETGSGSKAPAAESSGPASPPASPPASRPSAPGPTAPSAPGPSEASPPPAKPDPPSAKPGPPPARPGPPSSSAPGPSAPGPSPAKPPAPDPAQDSVADEVNPFSAMWGQTMNWSVELAAVRHLHEEEASQPTGPRPEPASPPPAPVPPPSPTPTPAHESDRPAVRPAASARPSPPPPSPKPRPPRSRASNEMTLVAPPGDDIDDLSCGRAVAGPVGVDILGTVVIGRAPAAIPGEDCQLLRVPSPERGISRSHVLLRVVADEVVALDLGSLGGTRLRRGGLPPMPLRADRPIPVHDGDELDLGEGIIVSLIGLP